MRRLRISRMTMIFLLAAALTLLAAACGGGKETNPEKLIPAGSNLIGQVNVNGILASGSLAAIYEAIPIGEDDPQTFDELLDQATEEIGIDIRQISQVALFGDITRTSEFFGIIAQGGFDELALITSIRRANDNRLVSTEYKGRLLYSPEDDTDEFSLAILEQQILVIGTREGVQAVIDVQDGAREQLSGPILDTFDDLGLGLFRLAIDISAGDFLDSIPATGEIPFLGGSIDELPRALAALQDIRFVGLALAQNGQILIIRVNLEFAAEDSASALGDLLGAALTLAAGLSPDPETKELLDKIQVDRDKSRMSIRLEVQTSELGRLISNITGVAEVQRTRPEGTIPPPVPRLIGPGEEIAIMPTSDHVPEGQSLIYSTVPPTSGDHWSRWAECGFYEGSLPDELITHNLEHGNIVVSYNLATQEAIDQLRAAMNGIDLAAEWSVTRFYDEIPQGTVAVAAWGRLDIMQGVEPERISLFLAAFTGGLGPERIAC